MLENGAIKIDVRLDDETVWLTQAQMCNLFQKSKATISEHIKNVVEEGEINPFQLFGNSEQLKWKVSKFQMTNKKVFRPIQSTI